MLMSIIGAHRILSKSSFVFSFLNVLAVGIFYLIMFCVDKEHIQVNITLTIMSIAAITGLFIGLYITFRTKFALRYALLMQLYFIFMIEILTFGSGAALAVILAGRPDLRWLAFGTNAVCLTLSLLSCIYWEAKAVRFWGGTGSWREEIDKYIDYSYHLINPLLTDSYKPKVTFKHPIIIAMVGTANIPLLFEIYGGSKANAIFFVAPLGMAVFPFVNFKIVGPALTRLLLLRKIEKEVGYRFQNADYEQIQEMRRGFFLAKWLMKDYRPPLKENVADAVTESKNAKKKKQKQKN